MFDKITEQDRQGKGNVGQPDTPALTTTEMQEQMDSLPNLIIDKFNALIDALAESSAAINIGAEVPEGIEALPNVESILIAMVTSINLCTQAKHQHANKTTLDRLNDEALDAATRLMEMFTSILRVDGVVTDSSTALPTCAAVKNYADGLNIKTKVLEAAYPVGAVYSTTATDPQILFGGTWTLIDTVGTIKHYRRDS